MNTLNKISRSYINQKLTSFDDEGVVKRPHIFTNTTVPKITFGDDDPIDDVEEETIEFTHTHIKTSLVFRKPTDKCLEVSRKSFGEDTETQCDSSYCDSDDEIDLLDDEQAKQAQLMYLRIMEKAHYLVKITKESKFRGYASPMLLQNKLYDILQSKR